MTYTCTHMPQKASTPIQGLDKCALTMGANSGLYCQIGALLWRHFTSRGFTKKHSGKADQLTLASGGSEYA